MKNLLRIFAFSLISFAMLNASAQTNDAKKVKKEKEAAAMKAKMDDKRYTFVANYMIPLGGSQRYLNTNIYDVKISKDSVQVYLPYWGKVYMGAPVGGNDGGYKFTSTKFDYARKDKKSGWQIVINFKDTDNARRLTFDVSPNGRATLTAISYNRDPITYYGDIAL